MNILCTAEELTFSSPEVSEVMADVSRFTDIHLVRMRAQPLGISLVLSPAENPCAGRSLQC